MSDTSKIEWTDATWNPVLGCDRVSPGCDRCYAISGAHIRKSNPHPAVAAAFAGLTKRTDDRIDWTGRVNLLQGRLVEPIHWRKPRKIFVNSMSDLFHDAVTDLFIAEVFAVMALTPQHTYQVLTKRHARMRSLLSRPEFWYRVGRQARHFGYGKPNAANYFADGRNIYDLDVWKQLDYLPNVWLGVSVEDQKRADLRIPALLGTPAAVRWVSAEPLLGPVDLDQPRCDDHGRRDLVTDAAGREWCDHCVADGFSGELSYGHWLDPLNDGIAWVVVGGETGRGARPMHPDWARDIRDQCTAAGVAFSFKQWGEWGPAPFVVRVPLGDDGRWHGTEAELEAAKRDAEAKGATHVHTGNWHDEDGERKYWPPHEMDHKPWSLERAELTDGMAPIRRWGKKAAGRTLDGRTWDEYPTAVTR